MRLSVGSNSNSENDGSSEENSGNSANRQQHNDTTAVVNATERDEEDFQVGKYLV